MKITPEHYAILETALKATLAKYPLIPSDYAAAGLSPMRLRWDLLRAARIGDVNGIRWACDNLYSYANDSHIDTALRHICNHTS